MMLEEIFHRPSKCAIIRRLPLGLEMDGYCEWLSVLQYSREAIRDHIGSLSYYNQYLQRVGIKNCAHVQRVHAERFLSRCAAKRSEGSVRHIAAATRSFMKYLIHRGLIGVGVDPPPPYRVLLEQYLNHLRRRRNLTEGTVRIYGHYLKPFFEQLDTRDLFGSLYQTSPEQVQTFFVEQAQDKAQGTRGQIQAAMRTFLWFCAKEQYIPRDLAEAVPKVFTYKLANVPRQVSDQDTQQALAGIDRTTLVGRRDYAMIQLLYTYGIRAAQVYALRLQDIHWTEDHIHFLASKGGKEVVEPLTDEVGESLLDYLQHGRPQAAYPQVFLTTCAPFHPLSAYVLYNRVVTYMRRAGVTAAVVGPQALRHAFATRMLKHGQSLKTIADMLGHRDLNSTFIYTKVDLQMLRQMPLDWPKD